MGKLPESSHFFKQNQFEDRKTDVTPVGIKHAKDQFFTPSKADTMNWTTGPSPTPQGDSGVDTGPDIDF